MSTSHRRGLPGSFRRRVGARAAAFRRSRRIAGLVVAAALLPGFAAAETAAAPGAVLVAPASVDPLLETVAEGLGAWLRLRVETAGLAAVPRDAVRSSAPRSRADAVSPEGVMGLAQELGAAYVVFPDVRYTSGQAEVRFRLYEPAQRRLVAMARATRPLGDIGDGCEAAAVDLLAFMGVAGRPGPAPQLDALASSGRALLLRDRGELLAAWREVERKLSPTAAAVREDVLQAARIGDGPVGERARVLAAAGDAPRAWTLIERDVRRSEQSGRPDAQLWLAAAEIELARHNPREARRYVDDLGRTSARSAEIQRLSARVLLEQNDRRGARDALRLAVELDPRDAAAAEQLASLEPAKDERRARLLLRAGQQEALRLNPHRASSLLQRAASESPGLQAESLRAVGEMERSLGRPAEALKAWRGAVEVGGGDATAFTGIGDSLRALGDADEAEVAYRKALSLAPEHGDALAGLGAVELARGDPAKAVPLLEQSTRLDPEQSLRRRNLAQALRATGDLDRALQVLEAGGGARGVEDLRLAAEIHSQRGQHERARETLLQATRLDPFDPDVQEQLAGVYAASGDAESARKAREFVQLLRGTAPSLDGTPDLRLAAGAGGEPGGPSLQALVQSFASAISHPRERAVVRLEIRDAKSLRSQLATWLHPRAPDLPAIADSLDGALADAFVLLAAPSFENPVLVERLDALYDFEDRASLDAQAVASLNHTLGTDAIFVARVDRMPESDPDTAASGGCAANGAQLEVRMLAGDHPDLVSIHANHECLAGAMATRGVWNTRAFGAYAALLLLMMFPLLRGWGRVEVRIKIPPKTKGFLAIRLSMKEDDLPTVRRKKGGSGRLTLSLRSLSRYEKQMAGRVTLFRWIPARKRSYYVTVKGPLTDAAGLEMIGHFLETQRLRVRRGRTNVVEFDFQPKESGVDVRVQMGDAPVLDARISQRGVPGSVRFARGGHAILPLGEGSHQLLVGTSDRVGEFTVHVETLGRSVQVAANLADENALVFQGCPDAVEPYLNGDYGTAAAALAAAGLERDAHLANALFHEQLGATDKAAEALEAAGRFEDAAELRVASGEDLQGSAVLFEKAGDHARAADAYRASGEILDAARCYEAAYDYDNALECYQEAGDDAKALEILEKTGEFFEAGRLAHRVGSPDRALRDLQQVEKRDANYGEACALIAEVLEGRGDFDVAADKIKEALLVAGGSAPAALHERHAELLSKAGRATEAIDAYQTVRRIEPQRRDVTERIAELERGAGSRPAGGATTDSRYEILGELGRGAMGVVYKARDTHLGRTVALKRLPDNLRDHPAAVALFRREAQAAAALNHRNIVTLFDAGEENGSYFITMELLEGLPLNQILKKKGRIGVGDACRLGIQITAGLHYAHEQRIVHRDIKAGNLFFTRDREIKIMDFGLAKTIEEVRKTSTMIGGTPYYMAPEQAGGEELDHRADLYALGVTLYQLVTGTVPFREGDLAYHHRHTAPPDPRTHAPGLPPALAQLILAMLAKSPDDRPADAAEVGRRLQAILTEHQQQG